LATLAAPGVSATARSRPDVTDHDLVQAVRAGDDHAFERLYHRYHRRISAYIFGMVHDHGRAEDLTQEVFVSALRRMRQTDRAIAFKPWIYEIAKNACIDAFRRSKRAEEVSYDNDESGDYGRLAAVGPSPDAAVDTKQRLENLCGAFGGLSEAHHQILVMRELEGLSYREIGERLGMTRPSVESTLFRARRRLTEEYEELVTGERCLRIQAIIAQAGQGVLGARDQRRVGSHIGYCQPCRRHARLAGLDAAAMARRPVRAKIAALLPLPAFLKRRWLPGGSGDASAAAVSGSPAVAQWSAAASQLGEPTLTWMKAAVVAGAVAVAGVGAGTAAHHHATAKHDAPAIKPAAARGATGGGSAAAARPHRPRATSGAKATTGARGTSGTRHHDTSSSSATTAAGGASNGASSTTAKPGGGSGTTSTAGGGAGASPSSPLSKVTDPASTAGSQPLLNPDPSQLAQPPSTNASTPSTPGGVVTGVTDTVGNATGGAVGDTVKGAGQAVGDTVDQAAGTAGGLLGGK